MKFNTAVRTLFTYYFKYVTFSINDEYKTIEKYINELKALDIFTFSDGNSTNEHKILQDYIKSVKQKILLAVHPDTSTLEDIESAIIIDEVNKATEIILKNCNKKDYTDLLSQVMYEHFKDVSLFNLNELSQDLNIFTNFVLLLYYSIHNKADIILKSNRFLNISQQPLKKPNSKLEFYNLRKELTDTYSCHYNITVSVKDLFSSSSFITSTVEMSYTDTCKVCYSNHIQSGTNCNHCRKNNVKKEFVLVSLNKELLLGDYNSYHLQGKFYRDTYEDKFIRFDIKQDVKFNGFKIPVFLKNRNDIDNVFIKSTFYLNSVILSTLKNILEKEVKEAGLQKKQEQLQNLISYYYEILFYIENINVDEMKYHQISINEEPELITEDLSLLKNMVIFNVHFKDYNSFYWSPVYIKDEDNRFVLYFRSNILYEMQERVIEHEQPNMPDYEYTVWLNPVIESKNNSLVKYVFKFKKPLPRQGLINLNLEMSNNKFQRLDVKYKIQD